MSLRGSSIISRQVRNRLRSYVLGRLWTTRTRRAFRPNCRSVLSRQYHRLLPQNLRHPHPLLRRVAIPSRILGYPLLTLALWSGLSFCLQASPATCKLVAYNLSNYSIQGSKNLPAKSPTSLSAIRDILGSLQPDILVLTEMGSQQDLLFLQKKLRNAGLFLPYTVWIDSMDPLRHLALLSRFPVMQDDSLRLAPTSIPNYFIKRGIMDITLRLEPHYTLRVVGVHLKSRRAPARQSHRVRFAEAQALASHVTSILRPSPDTKLLNEGDFNDYPASPTRKTILLKKAIPHKRALL